MTPLPPAESQLTDEQRKALRRISMLFKEHFHRALYTVIFRGVDDKLHVLNHGHEDDEELEYIETTVRTRFLKGWPIDRLFLGTNGKNKTAK